MNDLITIEEKKQLENAVKSPEGFPVDFDLAWQLLEYASKQKGLDVLKRNFKEEIDYLAIQSDRNLKNNHLVKNQDGHGGARVGAGRKAGQYFLTLDCFLLFCERAKTEKGDEVRKETVEIIKKWHSPEAVKLRARQLGVEEIPEKAKYRQIDLRDYHDLEQVRWFYAIGAITREDAVRFGLGGDVPESEEELSVDPLETRWAAYIEACRYVRSIPDSEFPLSDIRKFEQGCRRGQGDGSLFKSLKTYLPRSAELTPFAKDKGLSRECCEYLLKRYFAKWENDHPGEEQVYAESLKALTEERARANPRPLPPAYIWPRLSREEFDDLRARHESGMLQPMEVRALAFPDAKMPSEAAEFTGIPGLDYKLAMQKLEKSHAQNVIKCSRKGLLAFGIESEKIDRIIYEAPRETGLQRRKNYTYEDVKYIIARAYGVQPEKVPMPKKINRKGKSQG
jgi:hypothetical protein